MTNNKYMNEMIAEWVGFRERFTSGNSSKWWELSGYPFIKYPEFMNSETDCFRFIIPKLREKGYGLDITVGRVGAFVNLWSLDKKHDGSVTPLTAIGVDTNVSSAICMAVFELMKKEPVDDIGGPSYA
jgi:hypothetical protein